MQEEFLHAPAIHTSPLPQSVLSVHELLQVGGVVGVGVGVTTGVGVGVGIAVGVTTGVTVGFFAI